MYIYKDISQWNRVLVQKPSAQKREGVLILSVSGGPVSNNMYKQLADATVAAHSH
jgi:6-phosphogluconolactonase/glucosamine-6-phosphate isomerase/deaminase